MVQCNQDVFPCKNNAQVFLFLVDPGRQLLRCRITDLLFLIRKTDQKIGIAVQLQENSCETVENTISCITAVSLCYFNPLKYSLSSCSFRRTASGAPWSMTLS